MRTKIVKYGKHYLEVDVPDYANGETISECIVIEPFENLKIREETFIDKKLLSFFNKLLLLKIRITEGIIKL